MLWLIVLLIVGIVVLIAYRVYSVPPLSATAKQQRDQYLRAFQHEKTLVYQMSAAYHSTFLNQLRQRYFDAGTGCFYGTDLMIHVLYETSQVTIHLFCSNPQDLPRHTWNLIQLKTASGGAIHGATDG